MLWRKLVLLFGRRRADRDLDEEMKLHMELRARELRNAGLDETRAREEAARQFGNRTLIIEDTRAAWNWTPIEQLARDLRFALRALRKSPSFSLVAIASLAVALGANTAVFSFARAIVLKTLPVAGADRLVILRQHNEMFHMENCCFSYPFYEQIRNQDIGFEDAAAVNSWELDLTDEDRTEILHASVVSANFFALFGGRAALGRLVDWTDVNAHSAVCNISYRYWKQRYGAREDVIGRKVMINKTPAAIVGVTSPGFTGAETYQSDELFLPASMLETVLGENPGDQALASMQIIARLKPGVTRAQAETRLNAVRLAIEKSQGLTESGKNRFRLEDGSQGLDSKKQEFGKPVLLLFGLVGVVLLVACANLTALLLVRSVERTTEAGVRLALGGSRAALIRYFLAESLVLAFFGGIAAWGLAVELTSVLLKMLGNDGEGLEPLVRPNGAFVAFLAAMTLGAAMLFGFLPAWKASRCDPLRAMRGSPAPGGRTFLSRVLISAQIALSLALLFGAGLFVRTLHNLRSIDLGFKPENIAMLHFDLKRTARASEHDQSGAAFFEELLRRARQLPETRAASLSTIRPLSGAMNMFVIRIPGYVSPNGMYPTSYVARVSSGYFQTLGIPLLAGRDFNEDDRSGGTADGVAIVNRRFEREFLNGSALGKSFELGRRGRVRVVGIAGDSRYRWLKEELKPIMYFPVTQSPPYPQGLYLQVRSSDDAPAMIERLRSMARELDPRVPANVATTMELQIDQALNRERLLAFLSTLTGGLAVALAAIGLYGVMSFSVARRTREIGIRMAVGAPRSTILAQFLMESAWMLGAGIALGIPLGFACGKLASSLLYGLTAQDLATVGAATAILALIAIGAALIPALRAARLDPLSALRWE